MEQRKKLIRKNIIEKLKEVENVKCPICGLYTVIKRRCNPCTEALCTPLKEWVE